MTQGSRRVRIPRASFGSEVLKRTLATWVGLIAGCFDRGAGAGRDSQQPLIHSVFLSVGVQLERRGGRTVFVWGFVFLVEFLGEAQHRVKQRVEHDV